MARQRLLEETSSENVLPSPPVPPDGGWGWVVVFASLMCNIIVDGVCFSFGVFYSKLTIEFPEASSAQVSFIGSLLIGCYLLAGHITSALANRFGCRKVTIAGSLINSAAFALSSLATSVNQLIFLYGIIGGIGFGMIYLPAIVIVGFYFERRRAIATGIAVCGSGIGMLAFAPLFEFLLEKYDWRGANLIVAGITLNCAVCGALFRPLNGPKPFKIMKPKRHIREDKIPIERGNIMQKLIDEKARQRALSTHSLDNTMITVNNTLEKDPNLVSLYDFNPDIKKRLNSKKKRGLPKLKMVLSKSTGNINSKVNVSTIPEIHIEDVDSGTESELPSPEVQQNQLGSTHSLQPKFLINKHLEKVRKVHLSSRSGYANSGFVTPPREIVGSLTPENSEYGSQESTPQINNVAEYAKDLARPLYRKDIFYPGSINALQKSKSVKSLNSDVTAVTNNSDWAKSMITIPDRSEYDNDEGCYVPKPMKDVLRSMLDLSLLKSPTFLLLSLSSMLTMMGFFVPFVYIKHSAMEIGFGQLETTMLISVLGITNTIGRVVVGIIYDSRWIDCLLINNFALVIAGGVCIAVPSAENSGGSYIALVIYCAIYGLCIAAFVSLRSIILVELLGIERLTNAFGLLILFQGIATVGGSPLAGYLYDITGNYNTSFYTAGGLIAISGLLCFPLRKMAEREFKKEKMFTKNLYYSVDKLGSYYEQYGKTAVAMMDYYEAPSTPNMDARSEVSQRSEINIDDLQEPEFLEVNEVETVI